ncbi:MAG: phosphoribosyl-ATP diphosphatase [Eggerthellaceae bacterium]|nr:phosphoribosyl-ATP diphosphatase [Eggerthellaceae bacterium]
MTNKTYVPEGEEAPSSQIGATMEALACTIAARRDAGDESYTHRLLTGPLDKVLKKVAEEAVEVGLAAKDVESQAASSIAAALAVSPEADTLSVALSPDYDDAVNHLRYEAADVVYHLMVVLERFGIGQDEFAAELNSRMTESERPQGAALLKQEYIERGK